MPDTNEAEYDHMEQIKDQLKEAATDAIIEVATENVFAISREEANVIADELIDEHIAIKAERALGASATVTFNENPTGGWQGKSIKVTNIVFDIGQAAKILPDTGLIAMGGFALPHVKFAGVLAIFTLLNALNKLREIKLTQQQAGVLHTMWQLPQDDQQCVPHDGLLEKVNNDFALYHWQPLTQEKLIAALTFLERIGCVEKIDPYHSILMTNVKWQLKEQIKYSS